MSHRLRLIWLAVLGVVVALGPMLAVEPVVRWVALAQGQARLDEAADRMLHHADSVLGSAAEALGALAVGHVERCAAGSIRDISEAVYTRPPLKEIGIYDAEGRMLCSNFGPALVALGRSGGIEAAEPELRLGLVPTRVIGRQALGLSREAGGGGGLVAIVEPDALRLDPLHGDLAKSGHARIELTDGAPVTRSGRSIDEVRRDDSGFFEARRASTRFPLAVAVAAPRQALLAPFAAFGGLAKIGGGVIGVVLLAFVGVALRRRPTLEAEIDAAIGARQFVPFYQPVVDSGTGRVSGCEVLARWRRPGGEVVGPDLFVPFAEASGQIMEITRQLMAQAREDLAEICRRDWNFQVSFNLAPGHFASETTVVEVRRIFAKGGPVRPQNLVFELAERRAPRDMAVGRKVVDGLKALGAKVALDDAGTGHDGLATIRHLGLDMLKIHPMLIAGIGVDAAKMPVVDALLDIGRELGVGVVAKGVETEDQFAYLVRRGARLHQGFLFAPALPARSFACFVAAFRPGPAAQRGAPRPQDAHRPAEVGVAA